MGTGTGPGVDRFGVEGTGSYGAGLTRLGATLRASSCGADSGPIGARRRSNGKSDAIDAEAAARSVLAGTLTAIPKTADGLVEMIRQPKVAPDTARKGRTTGGRHRRGNDRQRPRLSCVRFLDGLTNRALINRCARYRVSVINTPTAAAKHSLKALARRWRHLDTEVRPPRRRPRRPHHPGVADTTRRIRHRSRPGGGDPHRVRRQPRTDPLRSRILRNSAAPAPSPLSSGQTNRNRLYRGGHRPSQRSAVPTSHSTNTIPPTHHRLRRSPHHRKPHPKRTSSAASNGSSPARSTNT